jgi:hypothetical protein
MVSPVRRLRAHPQARRAGITIAITGTFIALAAARRPEMFTQPQLYAEDGQAWLADAYNLPLLHQLTPVGGYLQLFQRLVAIVFAPLGLRNAAVAFAVVATLLQVAPPLMLTSTRCRGIVASDIARFGVAAVYLLMPNSELSGNLTNTQWHLAVLALLVVLATPPRSRWGKAFDVSALVLASLSGPYALLLLPMAAFVFRRRMDRWRRIELGLLLGTALVQVGFLVATHSTPRSTVALGASPANFVLIIANQVLMRFAPISLTHGALLLAVALTAGVFLFLAAGFRHGATPLRCLIVFAVGVALSGLLIPYGHVSGNRTVWDIVATGSGESRYFFLLSVALVGCAFTLLRGWQLPRLRVTAGAAAVFAVVVAGAVSEWRYVPLADEHLARYQAVLDSAAPGTVVTIPIDPAGWHIELIAR